MKVITTADVNDTVGTGTYSGGLNALRQKLEAEHTCNFTVFSGVTYDSKTDRYIANFATSSRKFAVKCTAEAATFLMTHNDKRGQWYLKVESGVLTNVTLFDYNS